VRNPSAKAALMRAGKRYTCPQCGEESPLDVTCFRCDILPVDENGNPPPPTFEHEMLARSLAGADALAVIAESAFIGPPSATYHALAREIRVLNQGRKARRELRPATTSIEATQPGRVHVRGRVEVVEPVRHPSGEKVALFLWRRRERHAAGDDAVETRLACGKLLLRDETGTALLDDDFFTLLPAVGQPCPVNHDAEIVVRAGDTLEVAGPAERRLVPELPQSGEGAYREAPRMLVLDGRPGALLVVRPVT